MAKAHDDGLGRIAEIVREGASSHSPLYQWMWKHHDRFHELLEATRPDWRRLAEGFAEIGMTGADGQPMTGQAARHTWWRVRRDKANATHQEGQTMVKGKPVAESDVTTAPGDRPLPRGRAKKEKPYAAR